LLRLKKTRHSPSSFLPLFQKEEQKRKTNDDEGLVKKLKRGLVESKGGLGKKVG
jgi:hypothetical protein